MPYARDHKPRTRRRILDAAAALFTAHGFEGTTIEDVMHACGLTRGGFYAHFPSKAELYAQALGRHPLRPGEPARDRLGSTAAGRWVDALLAACADPDSAAADRRWHFLATDAASRQPEVRAAYARTFEALAEQLRHEAAQGEGSGGAADRAALAAAALVVGTLAVAATVDDGRLRRRLVEASRAAARSLAQPPRTPPTGAEPARPDYLWAVDDRIAAAARRLQAVH